MRLDRDGEGEKEKLLINRNSLIIEQKKVPSSHVTKCNESSAVPIVPKIFILISNTFHNIAIFEHAAHSSCPKLPSQLPSFPLPKPFSQEDAQHQSTGACHVR